MPVHSRRQWEGALRYDDTPKSLNAGGVGSRRHWGQAHREKRRWEGIWAMLLLKAGMPRGAAFVRIEAVVEFRDARRRDSENYRASISKPLADALVRGGWLADDTDEFFEMGYLKLRSGCGPRTIIEVEARYAAPE